MRKRLVLVGGGHAHLFTLSHVPTLLAAGIDLVCVAPSPALAYSGMGPGMLAGRYTPQALRFDIAAMVERPHDGPRRLLAAASGNKRAPGSRPHTHRPPAAAQGESAFLRGRVAGIDPAARLLHLKDGREIAYDVASFAIGSTVGIPFAVSGHPGAEVFPVKPIDNLLAARRVIESRVETGATVRVLVAGGGPSGFEVAGNVLGLFAGLGVKRPRVTVAAGRGLLAGWPDRARRLAERSLRERGARIIKDRVRSLDNGKATLANDKTVRCHVVFVATGTQPSSLFTTSGLSADAGGGLTVNACLQSPFYPDIFGGGDCVHFGPCPLPRAGVYAVRQGPVLYANLLAALTGGALRPFQRTGKNYLAILNSGNDRAIARKGPLVLEGRLCMALKDAIDRRFMRSFGGGTK